MRKLLLMYRQRRRKSFRLRDGRKFEISEPIVMGVLNLSPDSFFKSFRRDEAVEVAKRMIDDGAKIVDVGAVSTRPGAPDVPEEEEFRRLEVLPYIVDECHKKGALVSLDTTRYSVAKWGIKVGVDIINDISGFGFDWKIAELCAETGTPAVCGHTTAKPSVMQKTLYDDRELFRRMKEHFEKISRFARERNFDVIVDPGIGFGKKPHQNFLLLTNLDFFDFGFPILVGVSRKSFLGWALDEKNPPPPSERFEGTVLAVALSVLAGADIVRVHDVKEISRVIRTLEKFAEFSHKVVIENS